MKRILMLALMGVVVVAGVFALLSAALRPSEHTVATVYRGPTTETVYATGLVEARERRLLRAPRAGVVGKVFAGPNGTLREGDAVLRGQPVLSLRDSALEARKQAASAELGRVSEQLKEGSPFRRALELRIAEAGQSARDERAREQRLNAQLASGGISKDEYEQARTRAITAEDREKSLQQEYQQAIANLEAARKGADAILQQIVAQELDDLIVAPIDGVLLRLPLKEGEFAAAGAELAMVGDVRELIIEAEVNEDDITRVQLGQAVKIRLAGHEKSAIDGRVFEVLPDADRSTKGFTVRIGFEDSTFEPAQGSTLAGRTVLKDEIIPYSGMTAELGVVVASSDNAIIFARTALSPSNTVFVVKDNSVVETRVTLGLVNFNACEAKTGLAEGDQVVTSDVGSLKHGQRIKVRVNP